MPDSRPLPWFLAMGEAASGTSTLIRSIRGRRHTTQPAGHLGCVGYRFDQAMVLDVPGEWLVPESADEPWLALIDTLARRGVTPALNGVILCIRAPSLQHWEDEQTAHPDIVADRLRDLTGVLSVTIPLYVILTQCDGLPGFTPWTAALSRDRRREILGWSNTRRADDTYQPAWVEDAWRCLSTDLARHHFQLLAHASGREADALFAFPRELHRLADPLRAYLDALFGGRPSDVWLRGVYCCGRVHVETETASTARPGTSRQLAGLAATAGSAFTAHGNPAREAIAFTRDLFEAKIFLEGEVARPSARLVRRRRRQLRVMQGALVVVLIAMIAFGAAAVGLTTNLETLRPLLETTHVHLAAPPTSVTGLQSAAVELMQHIEDRAGRVAGAAVSPWVPGSWLPGFHVDMIHVMALMHERLIVKAVTSTIQRQGDAILTRTSAPPDRASRLAQQIEDLPEYAELRALVAALDRLESAVAHYQALERGRDFRVLARLVRETIGPRSPLPALDGLYYVEQGLHLAAVPPLHPETYRISAQRHAVDLLTRVRDASMEAGGLRARLHALAAQLDRITNGAGGESETLDAVAHGVSQVQRLLVRDDLRWLDGKRFDLGITFNQDILAPLQQHGALDQSALDEWQGIADAGLAELKASLAGIRSSTYGPLLEQSDGRIIRRLAEPVASLGSALGELYALPFMQTDETDVPNMSLRPQAAWDVGELGHAVTFAEQSRSARAGILPGVPAAVQPLVERVGARRLAAELRRRIAGAQEAASATDDTQWDGHVRGGVEHYQEAAPLLLRLAAALETLGSDDAAQAIRHHVAAEAVRWLTQVDRALTVEVFYTPPIERDGACGTEQVRAQAAHDPIQRAAAVADARARIADLARASAHPLLTLITEHPELRTRVAGARPEAEMIQRWEGILSDLDRYERRVPNNAIVRLERFLLQEVDRVTVENFVDKLHRAVTPGVAYFDRQRAAVAQAVWSRCRSVAQASAHRAYADVARVFNERLAGHFPFADTAHSTAEQARPGVVRDFLRLLRAAAPMIQAGFRSELHPTAAQVNAREFTARMAALAAVLEPLLNDSPSGDTSGGLAFTVEPAQRPENSATDIAEWTVEVGDRSFHPADAPARVRWRIGDPIRVTLRWAPDASTLPQPSAEAAGMVVAERTVEFNYDDRWSLWSLLRRHHIEPGNSEDTDVLASPRGRTADLLRFEIPVFSRAANPVSPEAERRYVHLYVRLSLQMSGRIAGVHSFPSAAPDLPSADSDEHASRYAIRTRLN
jgi:type VI secretion system protein ImpL